MQTVLRSEFRVGTRQLHLTNIQKVLYPRSGFTKGKVIEYYYKVAPWLLPHLKDRPITLKRYPNGVDKGFFYEKRCPQFRPPWLKTAPIELSSRRESISFCVVNERATLVWLANVADLELHPFLFRSRQPRQPTDVVFDLDPGPGMTIVHCCDVALLLKKVLDRMKVECFVKTSGSKGMQVYVPLNTKVTFEETKMFARTLAEFLAGEHPDLIVSQMSKDLRSGKIFIDWSQNDDHKTTVAVYSLRASAIPTVSCPLTWSEVRVALKKRDPRLLVFQPDDVLRRLEKRGDIFEECLTMKQRLPFT